MYMHMSGPQKKWSTPPEGPTDPQALQCCLIRGTSPGGVRQKEHRLPARQAPRKTVGSLGNQWKGQENPILLAIVHSFEDVSN